MEKVLGTKSSVVTMQCQICGSKELRSALFLGYLPPVNQMWTIGTKPCEQPAYPAEILKCQECTLVQLGLIVDATILFPKEYPYTSSTTKVLRENFAQLAEEATPIVDLKESDLVIDIGSNDGNLLSNFVGKHKVLGICPEDIGKLAIAKGIPTMQAYFSDETAKIVKTEHGCAKLICATNVFAHIEDINEVVSSIMGLLSDDGVFISESHYLLPLLQTVQYDTIYHEHLRYYSLQSLRFLLERHGLEVFHARPIPSHGGSIRVYAARKGRFPVRPSVSQMLQEEKKILGSADALLEFRKKVILSKLSLHALLLDIKKSNQRIVGISAPSRASTLINYVGLDDGIIDAVLEVSGSHKIGKYVPGTLIPIIEERMLFETQPEYALLFSWHIADELIPKLKQKGFKGKFIVPLPMPRIVD